MSNAGLEFSLSTMPLSGLRANRAYLRGDWRVDRGLSRGLWIDAHRVNSLIQKYIQNKVRPYVAAQSVDLSRWHRDRGLPRLQRLLPA